MRPVDSTIPPSVLVARCVQRYVWHEAPMAAALRSMPRHRLGPVLRRPHRRSPALSCPCPPQALASSPAAASGQYVLPMPKWEVRESALLKRLMKQEGMDEDPTLGGIGGMGSGINGSAPAAPGGAGMTSSALVMPTVPGSAPAPPAA